ncbi:MAG: mRNA surveillance protein pelota [Candidatus Asgardarchaeia archaeon]
MRVLERRMKGSKGSITLIPQSLDDLWHLYNVITPGDLVSGKTTRRIRKEGELGRASGGERKVVKITISVENVSFHKFANMLRVGGRIVSGPKDIPLSSHHTLNVRVDDIITIYKDFWPSFMVRRIEKAEESTSTPNIIIVSMDDGSCCFTLVTKYNIVELSSIKVSIPGKRLSESSHSSSVREFFGDSLSTLKRYMKEYGVRRIIVAGPGFLKNRFYDFIKDRDKSTSSIMIVENSSVGCFNGAYEVVRRGALEKIVSDLSISKESELIEELVVRINMNRRDVAYGFEEVKRATEIGAVDTLLILDKFLHEMYEKRYKEIIEMMEEVENFGGSVVIFNSEHIPGDMLKSFGGIAALLRFSLPQK